MVFARRRLGRFVFACSLAGIGLLGIAALVERWLEIQDARRLAGSETFVDLGGSRVRYRLAGAKRPGPAVVLLTGLSGSIEQWDQVQTGIGNFAPVLVYDRGGSGFSHGSGAYDARQQSDELARLLTALGWDRRIILVGYSMSASVARVFAGRYRERVAGLILVAPYMPEIEGRIAGRHGPRRSYARWLLHESATTVFGIKRLAAFVASWRTPAVRATPLDNRVTAILARFEHWWAVDREVLATPTTSRQVVAAGGLTDLPVILLSDASPGLGPTGRVVDEVNRVFVERAGRGSLRSLGPVNHEVLLKEPAAYRVLIDAIRDMTAIAR